MIQTIFCNSHSPDNIAVIDRISLEQLWLQLAIIILASCVSSYTIPKCYAMWTNEYD
jgi:hypothetical protein